MKGEVFPLARKATVVKLRTKTRSLPLLALTCWIEWCWLWNLRRDGHLDIREFHESGEIAPRKQDCWLRIPHAWSNGRAERTHCPRGHAYDEVNTYYGKVRGERLCRSCAREKAREQSNAA